MIEINITRNDNAIYDVHFRTSDSELAKKIHRLLLEEFDKEEISNTKDLMMELFKKPRIELDETESNKIEVVNSNWQEEVAQDTAQQIAEEENKDLFEEKDYAEQYNEDEIIKFNEEAEPIEEKPINPNKMLQSTEEAGRQAVAEEREKAEKRKAFYSKVLYYILKDSPALYSMLSGGAPVASEGSCLIVNLPAENYKAIMDDKRVGDVVAKAILSAVNNSKVNIRFQSEEKMDMKEKIIKTFDATEVDIPY